MIGSYLGLPHQRFAGLYQSPIFRGIWSAILRSECGFEYEWGYIAMKTNIDTEKFTKIMQIIFPGDTSFIFCICVCSQGGAFSLCLLVYKPHEYYRYIYHNTIVVVGCWSYLHLLTNWVTGAHQLCRWNHWGFQRKNDTVTHPPRHAWNLNSQWMWNWSGGFPTGQLGNMDMMWIPLLAIHVWYPIPVEHVGALVSFSLFIPEICNFLSLSFEFCFFPAFTSNSGPQLTSWLPFSLLSSLDFPSPFRKLPLAHSCGQST